MKMADDMQQAVPGAAAENLDLRRQLIKRLTMAGGLVALLLALLALFDHLSQPVEEVEVPEFTEAVPVAPKKVLTQPVSAPPEEETGAAEDAEGAQASAEEMTPPPPVIAATPEHAPEQTAAPAVPAKAGAKQTGKAASSAVVPEGTFSPPIVADAPSAPNASGQAATAASRPARVVELTPPPARPARQVEGFLLQAGVFTSTERAEELHAKLTLNGIPTQVETRVQVGPFHTRQEALAAQAKLKALGIDSLLVMPKGSR
jgi:DedD protein